jgi:NAD(P)-dependent dehydrogenase (short-subunit alcohol dehydrogenase family)
VVRPVSALTSPIAHAVSAAGGQAIYPNFGHYHAAKWGIEGFCETAAREIAPFGIGLTIVEPGATPLRLPLGSDTYDDVRAALVARLAELDAHRDVAFSVVTGKPT